MSNWFQHRRKKLLSGLLLSAVLLLAACAKPAENYTMEDFAKVEKIDAHVHAHADHPAFLEQALADNFRLFTINVDYPDFPPIEEQQRVAVKFLQEYPGRIAYSSTFHMAGWDDPAWQEQVIRHLDSAFAGGAIAVKVWKNIGMDFRDQAGNLVMIDDPKFDPIFAHLREKNILLVGHQGEPKNCWLPIEEMTVNNDKEYFKNHPQYHMYLHPEFPSYEDQMSARDRMLEKNQELRFMGAHLASLEWSVDELAKFLERFPKAVVDMAARMGQVQHQSQRDREKVRSFFIKYQDRVLYATDLTHAPDSDPEQFKQEVHEKWLTDWKYLNTAEMMSAPEVDGEFEGLALPKKVIDKMYRINAEKIFPGAFAAR